MPLRIAYDGRYINDRYHGIGRVAFNLLEAITRLTTEHEFIVYLHPRYRNSRFDLRRLAIHPRVTFRSLRLPLLLPPDQLAWPAVLARDGADLFHSPYVIGPILGRVPTVVTIHDLILERFPQYTPSWPLRHAYRLMATASLRHATAVIAVSEATRNEVDHWYPATSNKTRVVHNGVDPAFGRAPSPSELARVRERYDLPPRFVLAIGAGRPHKNLEILVDAALLIGRSDVQFVIVSAADRRFPDRLGERLRETGERSVRRLARVEESDLPALYRLASAFVFPSLVEGFGLPMLEAMAAGTAVVASDRSSLPEVAGDAAIYFDPRDAQALSARLTQILDDPGLRRVLAARGIERARAFSWDAAARAVLDVYDEILVNRGTRSTPRR